MSANCTFRKIDDEEHLVYGEVYVPDVPDSQGDFMTAEEIKKMAHAFAKEGRLGNVDVQHDNKEYTAHIVETFVSREDDPDFIDDSWVVGVHVPDDDLWEAIKSGELNGFSLQALGTRVPTEMVLDIPSSISGETDEVEGHVHKFTVRFSQDGEFIGGDTTVVDGHRHSILKGTVTEKAQGHTHRFSFVEELSGEEEG